MSDAKSFMPHIIDQAEREKNIRGFFEMFGKSEGVENSSQGVPRRTADTDEMRGSEFSKTEDFYRLSALDNGP